MVRQDGKIPSDANTLATNTARYAHRKIVNIPGNYAILGPEMRRIFRSSWDRVFVGSDLSQIEMRMAAHFAYRYDDGKLKDMLLHGDFHKEQAENVYGCSRNAGKSVSYCILYGGGGAKVAAILGCSVNKGNRLIKLFWDFNEGLGKLKVSLEKSFKRNGGYIVNIDNRKTFVRAEYRLLNTLLQSSAAILFKKTIVVVDKLIMERRINAKLIITMHDEWNFDCCPDDVFALSTALSDALLSVGKYFELNIKVDLDTQIGYNWSDVH